MSPSPRAQGEELRRKIIIMEVTTFNFTDIIGYIASAVVLVSFVMKDIKTLRIINCIGCAFFVAYGVLLDYSLPIIITNLAIVGINIFYLLKSNKNV